MYAQFCFDCVSSNIALREKIYTVMLQINAPGCLLNFLNF